MNIKEATQVLTVMQEEENPGSKKSIALQLAIDLLENSEEYHEEENPKSTSLSEFYLGKGLRNIHDPSKLRRL